MGTDDASDLATWDARPSYQEWNVDVGLKGTFLAWWQTMLRDVVAIVSGVDDVCGVEQTVAVETFYNLLDHLVD